jgi:hypothetical protein
MMVPFVIAVPADVDVGIPPNRIDNRVVFVRAHVIHLQQILTGFPLLSRG